MTVAIAIAPAYTGSVGLLYVMSEEFERGVPATLAQAGVTTAQGGGWEARRLARVDARRRPHRMPRDGLPPQEKTAALLALSVPASLPILLMSLGVRPARRRPDEEQRVRGSHRRLRRGAASGDHVGGAAPRGLRASHGLRRRGVLHDGRRPGAPASRRRGCALRRMDRRGGRRSPHGRTAAMRGGSPPWWAGPGSARPHAGAGAGPPRAPGDRSRPFPPRGPGAYLTKRPPLITP